MQEVRIGDRTISATTASKFLLMGLATGWLYFDVLRRLVRDWYIDDNYSHGFLVPLIAGYAIWQHRRKFAEAGIQPRPIIGGALMAISVIMLWMGTVGAELFITRVSLLLALISLTIYFAGISWLRLLVFPLLLLLLAIPIPNLIFQKIAFPLQLLASDYAAKVINLVGIPALREGNVIELAQMKLEVVEACSGIRSLMSLTTRAVTYAYFTESRRWRQLILFVSVIPIAIITNSARVTVTGIMAHYRGEEAAQGFQHAFSGWLMFFVAMLLLLALATILRSASKFLPERFR